MSSHHIGRRFTYQPPHGDQAERYERIRTAAGDLATLLVELCPASDELDQAVTHIDYAVMRANAAIARWEFAAPTPGA